MLTDNNVLVRKLNPQPALMCAQRKAAKRISNEEDFIRSNIESFGNDIGQTTNWITSMFEVQSRFEKGTKEYNTLAYRIQCGQLYQQNAIDKAKGIICKPMPRTWHDKHSINKIEDESERELYRSISAEKKPYFMRYIYPELMKTYNMYIKNTNKNSLRQYQMTVDELSEFDNLTDAQKLFLKFYNIKMPVGTSDCVMNKICKRFESEFDGHIKRVSSELNFDYTIMKDDTEYSASQFYEIKKLYAEYNKQVQDFKLFASRERIDDLNLIGELSVMEESFVTACSEICPNEDALCNIVLDLCYNRSGTKRFAWRICGHNIIQNLLNNNERIISIPKLDSDGDITYCGERFSVKDVKLEVID